MSASERTNPLTYGGVSVEVLAGSSTSASFTLLDYRGPGNFHPVEKHRHLEATEWFLVLEGQITCWIDGRMHVLKAGQHALVQRGELHAWYNAEAQPFRMFVLFSSGRYEAYFERLFDLLNRPDIPPDKRGAAIKLLGLEYDNIFEQQEN